MTSLCKLVLHMQEFLVFVFGHLSLSIKHRKLISWTQLNSYWCLLFFIHQQYSEWTMSHVLCTEGRTNILVWSYVFIIQNIILNKSYPPSAPKARTAIHITRARNNTTSSLYPSSKGTIDCEAMFGLVYHNLQSSHASRCLASRCRSQFKKGMGNYRSRVTILC